MSYLSKNQIQEFYDTGYIVIEDVFSEDDLTIINCAIDRLEDVAVNLDGKVMHEGSQFVVDKWESNGSALAKIRRVVWCGAAEPILLKMGQNSRLTALAGQIMGCTQANHLINQVHFKRPHDNLFFPFHQDSRHRGYGTADWCDVNGKGSYVQMAMAIDEVTAENGPLLFIPESCRNGHLELPYDDDVETVSKSFNPNDAVPVLMRPGTVALFGPYTIHGSSPNTSDSSRRIFINGFAYPGANSRSYPGEGSGVLIEIP
jgi:ectoine hydroxylase-related dioxygenase (phytanoyl-CoA dioxygenase family)